MSLKNVLNALGDAVRNLTGGTSALSLEGMTSVLNNIVKRSSSDLTASGATVDVPAGYYASAASKAVATATQATPTISVDSTGKITASAEQSAGYVAAGTKSATEQLTTQAAQTITPGTSNKTVASGVYLTGAQTIKGDANLVAANIKKGVSIFDVAGTLSPGMVKKTGSVEQAAWSSSAFTVDTGLSSVDTFILYKAHETNSCAYMWIYTPLFNCRVQHEKPGSTVDLTTDSVVLNGCPVTDGVATCTANSLYGVYDGTYNWIAYGTE